LTSVHRAVELHSSQLPPGTSILEHEEQTRSLKAVQGMLSYWPVLQGGEHSAQVVVLLSEALSLKYPEWQVVDKHVPSLEHESHRPPGMGILEHSKQDESAW